MNLRSSNLYSVYSILPTYFVNCRRTLLKLNFKGPYLSSETEIKFRLCLFTFSIKHEIRHFHVVVVQKRERNVQKSVRDARAKLLFCLGPIHTYPDFCIRKSFYAETPSVHTCPPYTLDVSGDFCIRSPEWKFLHTLWSGYVWTLVSVYFCICWRHSIRTSLFPREIWLILWDVRMRIRYVWTVVYDSYTLHVDADIFVSA